MRTDHLTYQLATRISLMGFALQLVVSLVVLVFGFAIKDDVTLAGAYFMLLGLPVWVTLFILFHQHKLERIEAVEAEQLATQQSRSSSIFEHDVEDLNVAARRLRWMHRILVPFVSLLMVAGMLGIGLWQRSAINLRLQDMRIREGEETIFLRIADQQSAAWALAVTIAAAVICFIFSRYVAGMSKQRAWANMRGGASICVGTAIVNILLAVGHGFIINDNTAVMRVMAQVMPWILIVIGIEIAANFILNLYRPRRPGEIPRPAFDSRILSIFAAPDTVVRSISDAVNYQFGFEVTSSWFYQLVSRYVGPLIAFCVGLLILMNCVAVVQPHQQAIVTSFGALAHGERVFDSGLVWKWPWQRVERYNVHRIQEAFVGQRPVDESKPILWSKQHTATTENLVIVRPRQTEAAIEGGDDENVIAQNYSALNGMVPVQYRIRPGALIDYINFVGGEEFRRDDLIKAIAEQVVTERVATWRIDEVIGPQRLEVARDLKRQMQIEFDNRAAGIEIVFVGIAGVHPPIGNEQIKVADAFEKVLEAKEKREATIQQATKESIQTLAEVAGNAAKARQIAGEIDALERLDANDPARVAGRREVEQLLLDAGGGAAQQLLEARAQRWSTALAAWSQTINHNERLAAYRAAPELYTHRLTLNTMLDAMANARLYLMPEGVPAHVTVLLEEDSVGAWGSRLGETLDAEAEKFN